MDTLHLGYLMALTLPNFVIADSCSLAGPVRFSPGGQRSECILEQGGEIDRDREYII